MTETRFQPAWAFWSSPLWVHSGCWQISILASLEWSFLVLWWIFFRYVFDAFPHQAILVFIYLSLEKIAAYARPMWVPAMSLQSQRWSVRPLCTERLCIFVVLQGSVSLSGLRLVSIVASSCFSHVGGPTSVQPLPHTVVSCISSSRTTSSACDWAGPPDSLLWSLQISDLNFTYTVWYTTDPSK